MSRNIPALTGIRGVAALFVVLFHLQLGIARNGWLGVDLFFILSGFILMHVHRDLEQPTIERVRAFFLLRFFRVYPLHLAVLMAILALVVAKPGFVEWERHFRWTKDAYSVAGFFQTLTLTNRIGLPDLGQWNGPSWSLSSEALAYVIFPALVLAAARVNRSITCYLFCGCSLALFCVLLMHGHKGLARALLTFPVGVALARASRLRPLEQEAANRLAIASCLWIAAFISIPKAAPLAVFGFAGLIRALADDSGIVARALSSRTILFLGKISFSLYLTHYTLVIFSRWEGCVGGLWTPMLIAESLVVATLAYHFVERPSHRLGRKIAAREQNTSIETAAVSVS